MAKTQAEILEGYRTKVFKLSKSDFAHELNSSRQSYHLWLGDTSIAYETLCDWARHNMGGWLGVMAIELLNARGLELPCACLEVIGDNGPCPKHWPSAGPVVVEQMISQNLSEEAKA